MINYRGLFFASGTTVTCFIKDIFIQDAKIHLDTGYGCTDLSFRAWICHNISELDGDTSPERYGYKYSWVFNFRDGIFTDDVSDLQFPIFAESKHSVIDSEFIEFFKCNNYDPWLQLFYYKLGVFDEYNIFEFNKNEGFITVKNDKKSMEIKMSRLLRQMALKFNELIGNNSLISKLDVTDKAIETIYNKYIAFQKNNTGVTLLEGQDILKGYIRENYLDESGGTLHNSCMTGKLDFLKIYTENPNQVKLAVIYFGDKIAARSLVWKTVDGKSFHDRVYFRHNWMENLMKTKLNKIGIEFIGDQSPKTVQLENWKFERYPYVDNFYHFNQKFGTLVYLPETSLLRNTNGQI